VIYCYSISAIALTPFINICNLLTNTNIGFVDWLVIDENEFVNRLNNCSRTQQAQNVLREIVDLRFSCASDLPFGLEDRLLQGIDLEGL
jgi:hypothetical protein